MEYVTQRFENTPQGLRKKDAYSAQMTAQGYRIISEQTEAGHAKGGEQCCFFAMCMPCVFLAGRTPGIIAVTYGRDSQICGTCGAGYIAGSQCQNCLRMANDKATQAAKRTVEARQSISKIENVFPEHLGRDYRFNWQSLNQGFGQAPPKAPLDLPAPKVPFLIRCVQKLPALGRMFSHLSRMQAEWDAAREVDRKLQVAASATYAAELERWGNSKRQFESDQASATEREIDQYRTKQGPALMNYWTRVMAEPICLEETPPLRRINFIEEKSRLILDYNLPLLSKLPALAEVAYSPSGNTLTEVPISETRRQSLYKELLVAIALIALHKLFQSDDANALDSVVFNGIVTKLDRATGQEVNPCLITVTAEKADFIAMNLALVNPVACFERLNGTIAENLDGIEGISRI